MGLYTHDLTDEDIARLAASPLNCVISYQALSRETMDKMLAHGIRTIYTAGFWKEDSKKGDEYVARRIQEQKARAEEHWSEFVRILREVESRVPVLRDFESDRVAGSPCHDRERSVDG